MAEERGLEPCQCRFKSYSGHSRSVAQLVGHRFPKPKIEGSSPSRPVWPRDEIGRRADLKSPCPQGRAGSTPAGAIGRRSQ